MNEAIVVEAGAITVLDAMDADTDLGRRQEAAQVADDAALETLFLEYRIRLAENTTRRQDHELEMFGAWLQKQTPTSEPLALSTDAAAWRTVTFGKVKGYLLHMFTDSYSIGTMNNVLSTIKAYAGLAYAAREMDYEQRGRIRDIPGYRYGEGANADERRVNAKIPTRRPGAKKAAFHALTLGQIAQLEALCDDTPQGRRDRLIIMLCYHLGMRVSEACDLQMEHWDPDTNTLTVYRRKTRARHPEPWTYELQNGKLAAMTDYLEVVPDSEGQLLRGSMRDGTLEGSMSTRAIRARVRRMGDAIGVDGLGPHDLRHSCATERAKWMGMVELMDFLGWSSVAMAARYIKAAVVMIVA